LDDLIDAMIFLPEELDVPGRRGASMALPRPERQFYPTAYSDRA
jgi:hypothetical protein